MAITFTDWEHWDDGTESGVLDWTLEGLTNAPTLLPYIEAIRQAVYERYLLKSGTDVFSTNIFNKWQLFRNRSISGQQGIYDLDQLIYALTATHVISDPEGLSDYLPCIESRNTLLTRLGFSPYFGISINAENPSLSNWLYQSKILLNELYWFWGQSYAGVSFTIAWRNSASNYYPWDIAVQAFHDHVWSDESTHDQPNILHFGERNYHNNFFLVRFRTICKLNILETSFKKRVSVFIKLRGNGLYVNRDNPEILENQYKRYDSLDDYVFDDVTLETWGDNVNPTLIQDDFSLFERAGYYYQANTSFITVKGDIPGGFIFQ